ncbi:N-acetyltransferase [Streptomyces sp. NBC_00250]|uniref:GNAT family N-acetyltransferase n=1 Tax=Streptomyces sp. NBC_00250 TaxID=2903641 RepID=UPI002E2C7F8D|nr:GNAT family N-acetyltransferase [Streptomyces sp. NBC_00250]
MAEPKTRDDRANGRLEAFEGDTYVGVIVYFVLDAEPHALVAVHTVVEDGHEGKGIAGALVREFYAIAAGAGVPVVPLCPYAAKWAERHPDEAPVAPSEVVRAAKLQLKATPGLW